MHVHEGHGCVLKSGYDEDEEDDDDDDGAAAEDEEYDEEEEDEDDDDDAASASACSTIESSLAIITSTSCPLMYRVRSEYGYLGS